MTTQSNFVLWLEIVFLGSPVLAGFSGIFYSLYLKYRYLDDIIKALQNSRYICLFERNLRDQGWIGTILSMARISSMITIPKIYIKIGDLDPEDYQNFPPRLKRLLKIKMTEICLSGLWLAVVCTAVKLNWVR